MFFFFNDTATTEIYTLSLHDALPISRSTARRTSRPGAWLEERPARRSLQAAPRASPPRGECSEGSPRATGGSLRPRSEEHTSELQSRQYLVCRLLLEKKKTTKKLTCR